MSEKFTPEWIERELKKEWWSPVRWEEDALREILRLQAELTVERKRLETLKKLVEGSSYVNIQQTRSAINIRRVRHIFWRGAAGGDERSWHGETLEAALDAAGEEL